VTVYGGFGGVKCTFMGDGFFFKFYQGFSNFLEEGKLKGVVLWGMFLKGDRLWGMASIRP